MAVLPLSFPDLAGAPWVIGHRGAAGELLENTLPSFARAVAASVDAVELDVRLTADDELVVFHDADLRRLAGRPEEILTMTAAEVRAVELVRGPSPGAGSIPTLAEVLAALPPALPINVEVKLEADRSGPPDVGRERERLVASLARVAREHASRPGRLIFSSFDHQLLGLLRSALPSAALAVLDAVLGPALLAVAERLRACALAVSWRRLSPDLLAGAAAAGLPLLVYTVNDQGQARSLFGAGVGGVFTDLPTLLRTVVAPRSSSSRDPAGRGMETPAPLCYKISPP